MIRDFIRDDTSTVLAMCRELHLESPTHRDLPFDPRWVAELMHSATVKGWVADAEGTLRGYCFATVVPSLFGPARILTDLSIYVRRPYRNGLIAARFLRVLDAYGRELGVDQMQHVVSTGNPGIERLYERFGFARTGGAYVKTLRKPFQLRPVPAL